MRKDKVLLGVSLFSTGLSGVLIGYFLLHNPSINEIKAFADDKPAPVITEKEPVKTDIAERLSKDFIAVSKNVTPAVVSIYSTKIIKQKVEQPDFFDDPFFKRFFDVPDNHRQQDKEQEYKQQGLGSGVIVDNDGTILTNNHVVEGADEISVTLTDKRKFKAKVLGTDPKSDVAVIKLQKADNLPTAKLGDSSKLSVGEWVLAIGNPLGFSSTVTAGIISAKGRANVGITDFEDFIQTDAAINPGNSGGALVNLQGEVIGINTAIASKTGGYMGIGFAIPSNMAKKVMNDLITKGKVSRGWLGIQIQDMNENLAKGLKLKENNKGIIVSDVVKDSPAERYGLKRYDVIVSLNGNEVTDVNSFRNTIASTEPGKTVKIGVMRDGKVENLEIKLSEIANTKKAAKEEENSKPMNSEKLGFEIEPITPDLRNQLQLDRSIKGVVVSNVASSGNASDAGLMRGDIIQEVNRSKISSDDDFYHALKNIKSGDSVLLKVLRNNSNILIAFTVQ